MAVESDARDAIEEAILSAGKPRAAGAPKVRYREPKTLLVK